MAMTARLPGNFDSALNQLHRAIVNSQIKPHAAQHLDVLETGEKPGKGGVVRGGGGSSGKSSFGKLRSSD